jgi:hypothetical protein
MMTAAEKKSKKKPGTKAKKHAVKSDMLMSEDMEQTLLSEHAHKHGKPPNKNEFYHKKTSPHPDKK